VTAQPADPVTGAAPVSLTFANVTQGGITSLAITGQGNPPPAGFKLGSPPTFYDLSTTAVFSGSITIAINYTAITFKNPLNPKLFHLENGVWVNRTTSVDFTNHIIYATVTSLSPFAVFEEDSPTVTCSVAESLLWPPDQNLVNVGLGVHVTPADAGL